MVLELRSLLILGSTAMMEFFPLLVLQSPHFGRAGGGALVDLHPTHGNLRSDLLKCAQIETHPGSPVTQSVSPNLWNILAVVVECTGTWGSWWRGTWDRRHEGRGGFRPSVSLYLGLRPAKVAEHHPVCRFFLSSERSSVKPLQRVARRKDLTQADLHIVPEN